MNPKVLPLFVCALAVGLVLMVYALYQQQQEINALKIVVGIDGSVSIQQK